MAPSSPSPGLNSSSSQMNRMTTAMASKPNGEDNATAAMATAPTTSSVTIAPDDTRSLGSKLVTGATAVIMEEDVYYEEDEEDEERREQEEREAEEEERDSRNLYPTTTAAADASYGGDSNDDEIPGGGENDEDDLQTGINVLEKTYKDTGLSVRNDDYSVPTSTFDYLYEFSETRKVLEEFFKCPTFELDDEKFADKLSESECDSVDIRYDFVRDTSKKSPVRCSIENLDSGSPTGHLNDDFAEEQRCTEEVANEADVEDEVAHEEPKMCHRRRTFDLSISSLGRQSPELVMNPHHHHYHHHHQPNANNISAENGDSSAVNGQQSGNQYFRYSPESTDYDSNCGDLDSLSGDFNGPQAIANYQAYMRQSYASMPVLEDGLSSGHASDAENNNARARNRVSPGRDQIIPAPAVTNSASPFQLTATTMRPEVGNVGNVTPLHHHFLQHLETENSYYSNAPNKQQHTCLGNSEPNNMEGSPGGGIPKLLPFDMGANNRYNNCEPLTVNVPDRTNKSPFTSDTTSPLQRDDSLHSVEMRNMNINSQIFKNTDPDLESLYSINKFQSNGEYPSL